MRSAGLKSLISTCNGSGHQGYNHALEDTFSVAYPWLPDRVVVFSDQYLPVDFGFSFGFQVISIQSS